MLRRDLTRPDVWAPNAEQVEVVVDGRARPMRRSKRPGWWEPVEPLAVGARYAYSVDGGAPLPDPRALSQPEGVHGPSEVVDPSILQRDTTWRGLDVRGRVLYELHVGTFTEEGTLDAAITKLAHLAELGVDAVELMPVATFPGERGWGYDGVGQYAVHHAYGGPAALARFVDAAHSRGIAVLLDVVYNHFGPEGSYVGQFGPYFTDHHQTPWGDAVNMDDDGSDEVRAFLIGAVRQWLVDFQLDGLRLDAVHAIADDSEPHFLAELADVVDAMADEVGRPLTLIAESDLNQPAMVSPVGSVPGARGMDAQWADDVHHALHSFLTGETQGYYVDFGSAQTLAKALTRVFVHDGGHSTFRDRPWGAPIDPHSDLYDGHSFVVFLQNHDQVGNRAVGDRIGHTIAPALQAAGAALYLLGPFTPMLFMGEEWATASPFPYFSHLGPELGPKVTEGRAREFAHMGWDAATPDPQDEATVRSAVLDWAARENGDHDRMLDWYRTLIALRRRDPDLRDPRLSNASVAVVDDDSVVMRRGGFSVAVTRSPSGARFNLAGEIVAAWDEPRVTASSLVLDGPGVVVTKA